MNKDFCQKIDQDDLIEKYISGELSDRLKAELSEHIKACPKHAEALRLEQALSSGVRDYARSELKNRLMHHIKKQEISKYYILRYAAILVVAIMTPILLYYQFTGAPSNLSDTETVMEVPSAAKNATRMPTQEAAQPTLSAKRSAQKPAEISSANADESAAIDVVGSAAAEPDLIIQPDQPGLYQQIQRLLEKEETQILNCISKSGIDTSTQLEIELYLQPNGTNSIQNIFGAKISPQEQECIQKIIAAIAFPMVDVETIIRKKFTTK
jgi:hypothetical protein